MQNIAALYDGFKSKLVSIKDVCDLVSKEPSCNVYDASCILMVEKEFRRIQESGKQTLNVYIAGPTCSGKTTLAEKIKAHFKRRASVTIIHQDDYFKDLKDIPHGPGGYYMDSKKAFYIDELKKDFKSLLAGNNVRVPHYDIGLNRRIGLRPIITKGCINIVEGLHAIDIFKDDKDGVFFYMNDSIETCLSRRVSRDTKAIGVSEKRVKEYFEECIKPMYEKYILPQYHLMGIDNYYKYRG